MATRPESCACPRADFFESEAGTFCMSCALPPAHALQTGASDISNDASPSYEVGEAPKVDDSKDFASADLTSKSLHQPLKSRSEIRLIRLLPGAYLDELHCEILHVRLEEKPQYEALSYTWGEPIFPKQIFCHGDGRPMGITVNCALALRDLRQSSVDRLLWIDAICINQSDNREKSHQVPLMSKIFAEARRVLIHVGDPSLGRDDAHSHEVVGKSTAEVIDTFRRAIQSRPQTEELPSLTHYGMESGQTYLSELLSRPWFSRVWVLQEVAVATKAVIISGSKSLDWTDFTAANLSSLGLNPVDQGGNVPYILQLSQGDTRPFRDIASLISASRSCESTDPRDKVYALLGLLDDHSKLELAADYNLPASLLYAQTAARIIAIYNHLDLLSEAGDVSGHFSGNKHTFKSAPWSLKWSEIRWKTKQTHALSARSVDPAHLMIINGEDGNVRLVGTDALSTTRPFRSQENLGRTVADWYFGEEQRDLRGNDGRFWDPAGHNPQESFVHWVPDWHPHRFQIAKLNMRISSDHPLAIRAHAGGDEEIGEDERERLATAPLVLECKMPALDLHQPTADYDGMVCTGLPSWVPDLSRRRQLFTLAHWRPRADCSQSNVPVAKSSLEEASTATVEARLAVSMIRLDAIEHRYVLSTDHVYLERMPKTGQISYQPTAIGADWYGYPFQFGWSKAIEEDLEYIGYGTGIDAIRRFSRGRVIVLTGRSFAICSPNVKGSDIICAIRGASVPYVVRPIQEEEGCFTLIGECYLHGLRGPKFADDYWKLLGRFARPNETNPKVAWETATLV